MLRAGACVCQPGGGSSRNQGWWKAHLLGSPCNAGPHLREPRATPLRETCRHRRPAAWGIIPASRNPPCRPPPPNPCPGFDFGQGPDENYFLQGDRGYHKEWDSRLFNYAGYETLRYLLSNLHYWIQDMGFDGFRFDGVTSMLYHHHGIGIGFTGNYSEYFRWGRRAAARLGAAPCGTREGDCAVYRGGPAAAQSRRQMAAAAIGHAPRPIRPAYLCVPGSLGSFGHG